MKEKVVGKKVDFIERIAEKSQQSFSIDFSLGWREFLDRIDWSLTQAIHSDVFDWFSQEVELLDRLSVVGY